MLPLSPARKEAQKRKVTFFRTKLHFSLRKYRVINFLYVKNFTDKVVKHSLAYLFVHKYLTRDVLFY